MTTMVGSVLQPLADLAPEDEARIGPKAWRLHLAAARGLPVPEAYCLDRAAFDAALAASGLAERWRATLAAGGIDLRFRLQVLAQELRIEPATADALRSVAARLGRVAVRSSQGTEDNEGGASAGAFVSVLDVGPDEIEQAATQAWAGAFSPTYHGRGQLDAGTLLIQRYIEGTVSGICFTRDPVAGSDIVVTAAQGSCAQVCSGETGTEGRLPRAGECEPSGLPLTAAQLTAVRDLGLACEALLGEEADVEWTFEQDRLALLQLRPIEQRRRPGGLRSCDLLEVPADFPFLLSADVHRAWSVKRIPLRRAAQQIGLTSSAVRYLHIGEAASPEALEAVLGPWSAPWTEVVESGSRRTRQRRAQLAQHLHDLRAAARRPITLRLEGVIENDHCGYGAVQGDDVVLEYAWGFYASIDRLGVQPARVTLDPDGVVRAHTAPVQTQAYVFDHATGALALRDAVPDRLPDTYLAQVGCAIRALSRQFAGARFEWVGTGSIPYLIDASFERGGLPTWSDRTRVISDGAARGPVVMLPNVAHLEAIWPEHVSVWRDPEFFARMRQATQAVLLPGAPAGRKCVIVAPYPATVLALLLDHAAGFVFERGSALCHLAIILRHHRIPAYVVGDEFARIASRTELTLPDDVVA